METDKGIGFSRLLIFATWLLFDLHLWPFGALLLFLFLLFLLGQFLLGIKAISFLQFPLACLQHSNLLLSALSFSPFLCLKLLGKHGTPLFEHGCMLLFMLNCSLPSLLMPSHLLHLPLFHLDLFFELFYFLLFPLLFHGLLLLPLLLLL